MIADGDGPGWRTRANRRESDRAFLAAVRRARDAGDLAELARLDVETNEAIADAMARGRIGPHWRSVAIARALETATKGVTTMGNLEPVAAATAFVRTARAMLETGLDQNGSGPTDFGDEGDRLADACDLIDLLKAELERERDRAVDAREHVRKLRGNLVMLAFGLRAPAAVLAAAPTPEELKVAEKLDEINRWSLEALPDLGDRP